MENTWKEYADLGQKWLKGEVQIAEFNGMKFNPKQIEFINAKERYVLFNGGMGSGKTAAYITKLILLCLFFPNNRVLLGRKTRSDVERATLPDFFDLCPPGIYEHKVGPGLIKFGNGSEIILFGLDASASGMDIKKAEQHIKSLNLGAFFIDQLEETEERVFTALTSRLRRNVGFQQGNATGNPANYWGFSYFKTHPKPGTRLIETSMLDNKANLPAGFIEDQLAKPKLWVQKYVYGEWSTEYLSENTVFSEEYIRDQKAFIKEPIRTFDNIKIFEEPVVGHEYQVGIDPSEGAQDPCGIVVVDKNTGDVVATYNQHVPVEKQAETAAYLAYTYNKAVAVPESTGVGAAFILDFKKRYPNIYTRKQYGKYDDNQTEKLGFSTNYSSKTMLIEHMKELFGKHFPKIHDQSIISELQTFTYSDEAKQKGAGAQPGFHDDLIMATLLAFWEMKARDSDMEKEAEKISKEWSKFKLYGQKYR